MSALYVTFLIFFIAMQTFDMFILMAIVVNCVMMAMSAPLPKGDTNQLNNKIVSNTALPSLFAINPAKS